MKRKKEKVPGFDEIIFENRNKEYGAYDLRKRYKSVTSLSIISAVAFCLTLFTVLFFTIEEGTASSGPETIIIAVMDDYDPSLVQPPVETKPPPELIKVETFHGTSLLQHICQFFYFIKQRLETISG